jgi:hypothetical protein
MNMYIAHGTIEQNRKQSLRNWIESQSNSLVVSEGVSMCITHTYIYMCVFAAVSM